MYNVLEISIDSHELKDIIHKTEKNMDVSRKNYEDEKYGICEKRGEKKYLKCCKCKNTFKRDQIKKEIRNDENYANYCKKCHKILLHHREHGQFNDANSLVNCHRCKNKFARKDMAKKTRSGTSYIYICRKCETEISSKKIKCHNCPEKFHKSEMVALDRENKIQKFKIWRCKTCQDRINKKIVENYNNLMRG